MKKYLASILLLAASAAMPLWAQHPGMAKQKAQPLLEKHFGRSVDVSELTEVQLPLSAADAPLKAFNLDGGGFALLHYSDDTDGEPALIGYSDRGSFSEEGMPEPLRQWIQDIAVQQPSNAAQAPFHYDYTPVAPLLRTQWGQREPFNAQCPTYNDAPTLAGCTAVALAQVLYYYQSENTSQVVEEYVDDYTKAEISVDYSRGRYDWANMLPVYEEGAYTEQQAQAVARLMFEAGVACHCKYKDYATSGFVPYVALQQHYNFNCNYYYRPFVSTEMWMATLQRNLLEGHPIIYSGGSHAYVVDGIDANGLCHVNWGWAGLDDGYYDITYSQPPSYSGSGFTSDQCMIVDICPRTAGERYEEKLVQVGMMIANPIQNETWSTYNCSFSAVTTNYYHTIAENVGHGFIRAGEPADPATNPVLCPSWIGTYYSSHYYSINGTKITIKGSNGAVVGGSTSHGEVDMPDGTYEVRLISGDEYDPSTWRVAEWPSEYMATVEVRDGHWYVSDDMVNTRDSLYVHDFQAISDVFAGSYFYVELEMELDKEFRGRETPTFPGLPFADVETGNVYVQNGSGVNSRLPTYYPGVRATTVYRVRPLNSDNGFAMSEGRYRFAFDTPINSSMRWANATGDDVVIDVADKPEYPVLDVPTSSMGQYGIFGASSKADIKVLAKDSYTQTETPRFYSPYLYSANLTGGNVVINVYAQPEGGGEEFFVCALPDFPINANTQSNTLCYLPVTLYPLQGAYRFTFRYLTPDGERPLLNPLALGHRVFVYGTNAYSPTLQAISQLTVGKTSPSPSKGGEDLAGCNSSINKKVAGRPSPPLEGSGEVFSLQVRNRGTRKFEGTVTATFINTATGDFLKAESEPVAIASGGEAEAVFRVSLPAEGTYDVYFDGLDEESSTAVAVLRDDLQLRAHQTLTVGTSGIKLTHNPSLKGREGVYDLSGRKLSTLLKGVYIVNGKKIVID